MPPPGGGFVLKPAPVRVLRHAAVHRIRRRRKLIGVDGGQHKSGFQIAAHAQHHHLLIRRRAPPCTGTTGTQRQPVNPVSFKLAHFHPAQPVFPVHFGHGAGADQVGDKAHDFGQLCIHNERLPSEGKGRQRGRLCQQWHKDHPASQRSRVSRVMVSTSSFTPKRRRSA
ncbi:Uncharacterised protein [Salmonella enterica subsp. enterica serovar Typhi]|nr:Uncharacterised protein [Salmonella enterica subsp. enterica serovar Typhi]